MSEKLRIGILFGGPSAERENSFQWVKNALPYFDRRLFEPILLFVDPKGNFILVEPAVLTDETTHRFYPSRNLNRGFRVYLENLGVLSETQLYKLIYKIGKQVRAEELSDHLDVAFLALYGSEAETGQLQGLLEWHHVPYTGAGLVDSVRANNRRILVELLKDLQPPSYHQVSVPLVQWQGEDIQSIFLTTIHTIGFPFFISNPHRAYFSHHIPIKKRSLDEFTRAMQSCFGEVNFLRRDWTKMTTRQKKHAIERIHHIEKGLIFPLLTPRGEQLDHPADVMSFLDAFFENSENVECVLKSIKQPSEVILESYTNGQEFFCTLLRDSEGQAHLLEPLERIQLTEGEEHYIPMQISLALAEELRNQVIQATAFFDQTFLIQIRGVISSNQQIRLFSVDTTPFLTEWHLTLRQVATLGFSPSQFLTYFIHRSLHQRLEAPMPTSVILPKLAVFTRRQEAVQHATQTSLGVLFEEDPEQYLLAQQKIKEVASANFPNQHIEALCLAANGHIIRIPLPWMYLSSFELFKEILGHKPSPEWLQVAEKFQAEIPPISSKEPAWALERWDEQKIAQALDTLFYVGEGLEVSLD